MTNIAPYAFAFECGLIVLAAFLGWLFDHSPLQTVRVDGFYLGEWTMAVAWGLFAAIPPVLGLMSIERVPFASARQLVELVDTQIAPLFAGTTLLEFGLVSLAAGFAEELLFRGLLQHGLANWWGEPYGVLFGILVASAVFALGHSLSVAYWVLAFGMSVYLGVLFHWSDNLLAPVTTHAAYDFFALWYLLRHRRPPTV